MRVGWFGNTWCINRKNIITKKSNRERLERMKQPKIKHGYYSQERIAERRVFR